jgi:hypothetical protein
MPNVGGATQYVGSSRVHEFICRKTLSKVAPHRTNFPPTSEGTCLRFWRNWGWRRLGDLTQFLFSASQLLVEVRFNPVKRFHARSILRVLWSNQSFCTFGKSTLQIGQRSYLVTAGSVLSNGPSLVCSPRPSTSHTPTTDSHPLPL